MEKKEDEFCQKLMKFVELDWSTSDTHQRSQNNLRRVKWLKGVYTNGNRDIEFQELEKCLSRMMEHWSFYWDGFTAVNNGDNTFSFVTSLVDDVYADRVRVVKVIQAGSMYDLYGKVILAAYANIKCGLIVTRNKKQAWREDKQAEEQERKLKEKQRMMDRARREKL